MVNIPGILGFSIPGAFSIVRSRQGAVTLPGGPTILCIMGQGQREATLVESAIGGGADGAAAQFDPRLEPDGRHFLLERAPIVPGSVQLFLNPRFDGTDVPLIEITDADEGAAWADEFGIRRVTQVDQINGDTSLPPTELDDHANIGYASSNLVVVQGFRPGVSGRLAKLELWLDKVNTPLDDLIIKIWPSAGDLTPTGVGTELATVTVDNADIGTSPGWVEIEFDLTVSSQRAELTEGELYFISIERSSGTPDTVNYFTVGKNESNSYGQAGENTREGDPSLWPTLTAYDHQDLLLRTYMNRGNFGTSYDLYGVPVTVDGQTVPGAGFVDEDDFGLDGYEGSSDGSGFFDTKHGRRYRVTSVAGETERQHYYIDYMTGQVILDHALEQGDRLLAVWLPENDLNEFELFFDLEELYAKHGFPSVDNTISQAASMASLNNAPVIGAIHAGTTKDENTGRFLTDIFWADAFAALEKEDINFVVPIVKRDIVGEVLMPKYDTATHGPLTGGGTYLQEVVGGGDEPGINIYPLACDESGAPLRFELYKNGQLLQRGIDYTLDYVCQGASLPTRVNLTVALVDGDHVVANYRPDIDLVAAVQTVALQHVEYMSSVRQRKERTLWTGAYEGFGFDEALDPQTGVANVFGRSFRCMYFFPDRIRTVIAGETAYLDGQYLAACGAGFLAGEPYLPTPLTRKNLVGFDIEKDRKYTIDQLNLLGDDGLTVVEPLSSGGRVVYGLTTVQSGNPVEEEISVVRIRDYVAQTAREVLENRYIGGIIDNQTVANIKNTTNAILESLVAQRIITEFANVTAKVDSVEPRQVNVGFDVAPVFPLNWIFIEFSIGVL